MKKSFLSLLALALGLIVVFTACGDKDPGFGGEASINGSVSRLDDNTEIPDAIVYVAFGQSTFPGTDVNLYDYSTTVNGNTGVYTVSGLNKGDYYLYAVGVDPNTQAQVTGDTLVSLTKPEQNRVMNIKVSE